MYAEPREGSEVGLLMTEWNAAAAEHLANQAVGRAGELGVAPALPMQQPATAVV